MDTTAIKAWLHQGTTILGIAACGTATSAWLLDQATPKQALAMAIGGVISIAMKQASGTTVVTGSMPVVNTTETTIAPASGTVTTIKALALLVGVGLGVSGCAATTMQSAVPVAAVQDVQTALNTYQAALGVAQVAVSAHQALSARLASLSAEAAPYVAAAQSGTTMARTAPTLAALAAQLLIEAAPYIAAVPNMPRAVGP